MAIAAHSPAGAGSTTRDWLPVWLPDVVAILLILAALGVGLYTTRGLDRPYDPDHFRDIAQAQTSLDGHPLSDPNYRDEWIWYSPLLPWTLALLGRVTGLPLETLHVRSGPFLNLFGPIALYLLAIRVLANRTTALLALVFYLCAFGRTDPGSMSATYSPWLFASNFAQGLFFAAVLTVLGAARHPGIVRAAGAGATIGLTFLAHTAPGLLAVAVAIAVLPWTMLAVSGLSALLVVSPFLTSIVGHYHLRVITPSLMAWNGYTPLTAAALPQTLVAHGGWFALSAIGAWALRVRSVIVWLLVALALTIAEVQDWVHIVPASHFWIYVRSALALLSAAGVAWLLRRPSAVFVVALSVVAWAAPGYPSRPELRDGREVALSRNPDHSAAARYLRDYTPSDAVVLGTYGAVNLIIGPSGRKTVASGLLLSNPYIDVPAREIDRERLLRAITERDGQTFDTVAAKHRVTVIVLVGQAECLAGREQFEIRQQFGDVCILDATVRREPRLRRDSTAPEAERR